ncbi:ribosome biogenesis GTP-binding protein YihA/YsxC [Mycoplasma zalophidermidis]|uniref:Probable GTP-binding protein EngB n=1 Tax=Mycoplasma zalophidermidis TaxID=398174 RepID=A0ABS6DSC5_9MOLU|nr:ribosome biogenesis GTP-binding protein YihA/YsxC [Mycoplasma zalophidermidis]MBU4689782.1 ribosome biogenesis GTP-binding protein YihA/YsxC [Mycoplasma zalophidermidis]MBU4693706.1 ribosome biogenesis GTP-binding protein YihA/YsxC [Mycoplasma zalophidermidis]MCR8966587.1 ribosome biogenesis GTP-binding protein YihA/YsxC [Mycoplasma zalophidermidis]
MWRFITSSLEKQSWHNTNGNNQVVFWGRSNVGKSSLLNALTGQKVSFVSKKPGRTQLINFFADNNDKYIVDLPGYGYAEMSKTKQEHMLKCIKDYLTLDKNPKHIFLLIDSRTGITKIDFETLSWLQKLPWDISIIYTKIDKLNQKDRSTLIKKHDSLIEKKLLNSYLNTHWVSAEKKLNLDELVLEIESILYPDFETDE